MQFPFFLVAAVFVFFAGTAATSLVCFLFKIIRKEKTSPAKVSLFIFSISVLILCIALSMIFFKSEIEKNTLGAFLKSECIYFAVIAVLGILFFLFTKIFVIAGVFSYAGLSLAMFLYLNSIFPRKSFFELKADSPSEISHVNIQCHELNPKILLCVPRFWYELNDDDGMQKDSQPSDFAKSFFVSKIFKNEKTLFVKIPEPSYYPVIFKLKIASDLKNVFVKAEPVL
ncbi:MAG: hypothetical protein ACI4LX_08925 [Treponema sp.]